MMSLARSTQDVFFVEVKRKIQVQKLYSSHKAKKVWRGMAWHEMLDDDVMMTKPGK